MADKEFAFKIPRGVDVVTDCTASADRTRSRRLSPQSALVAASACRSGGGCAASSATSHARDAERLAGLRPAPSSSTPRRCGSSRTTSTSVSALDRAKLRASQRALSARPAAGRDRQARRGAGRVPAGLRAEPDERRGRRGAARRPETSCARRSPSRAKARPELQTLIERTRDLPPPGLDLPPDVKMPTSLMFRDASSRDVFLHIARFADISMTFDPTFRESPVTIDLRNASLEDALNAGRPARRARSSASRRPGPSPSFPTRRPSAASTRKKSCGRST